jgi:hypothetical protein
MSRKLWDISIFCLQTCWLEVITHLEGPATGNIYTSLLGFPLPSSRSQHGPEIPVASASSAFALPI